MHPGIVIGWILVGAAVLQPLGCWWIAARKARSIQLWVGLGSFFGLFTGVFSAFMLMMMVGFGAEDECGIVLILLLACLWPFVAILCLPKTVARTLSYGRKRRVMPATQAKSAEEPKK